MAYGYLEQISRDIEWENFLLFEVRISGMFRPKISGIWDSQEICQ